MTPERWKRTEELFHETRARPPADRAAFLASACPDDDAMRRNVESLLAESSSDSGFLAEPAVVLPALLMSDVTPMSGRSLGGYRIRTLLGAGGMGEVYEAHDPKLGRDVAIKILPRAFTSHPDRLARFEREARMLASLNHPNICGIYGIEESDGIRFLVLELVGGETLADKLSEAASRHANGGGLPLGHALRIARQITDALEVAHDKGIIHRDLKPANIKMTPDGTVKVLDFGLAKPISGEGAPPDLSNAPQGDGRRREGVLLGTAAYMSPEQARGLPVDKRTDIWAFGCVLYEMLTGRVAFAGDTVSDSLARILEREPDWSALPAATPAPIRRLLRRCLAKDPKQRLRDIGDVRIEIDAVDEVLPGAVAPLLPDARSTRGIAWLPWAGLALLAVTVGTWEARRPTTAENPLDNAAFSRVTNWEGTEEQAEISPDGRFVAFLADRAGHFDVWVTQLGTGGFENLTPEIPALATPGNLLRSLGFSFDGSEIWLNPSGNPGQHKVLMPLTGGTPRPFLREGESAPSWSPDDAILAYVASSTEGDPLFLADRTGADARPIVVADQGGEAFFRRGVHTHNPVWSPDGRWIYFVRGTDRASFGQMDVWRVQPSGESPEQLTHQNAPVNFLAPLDSRTLLYVARADDWSGPWLWALDVESKRTRRVTVGLEQYMSVSASRDGRRVVATVAKPTASLWRVPLLDRLVDDGDAQPYPVQTERALAPRFGGTTLFYLSLSARGTGDGLWRFQNGQALEVRKGADGVLSEPPVVSPDGSRVAVIVSQHGKRHLAIMSADGTNSRALATSIDIHGVVGQGTADWSPDGTWIVTGGRDEEGLGLFKIPVDGGAPVKLVPGEARNPVWSPKGDFIVYATPFAGAGGRDALRGVRPDGTPVQMPEVRVRLGGAHRFLRTGAGLVYLPGIETKDFWLVDLATNKLRQLTQLSDRGYLNTFDITPDGQHLVFDRSRQNSDVVLIEVPKR
jgi:serine/threonine protein kinase/Tol biopolymer transport system component